MLYYISLNKIHIGLKQFSGIKTSTFKKYGTVSWLKDGNHFDPATDGKDVMVRGFEINSFQPEDAGLYEAHVKFQTKKSKERCNATVIVEMVGKFNTKCTTSLFIVTFM